MELLSTLGSALDRNYPLDRLTHISRGNLQYLLNNSPRSYPCYILCPLLSTPTLAPAKVCLSACASPWLIHYLRSDVLNCPSGVLLLCLYPLIMCSER